MPRVAVLIWIFCASSVISAFDIFESFIRVGPCFEIIDTPECNSSIPKVFRAKNPLSGTNEPTTSFFLFTPTVQDKAEPLHQCGGRLPKGSTFDPSAKTVVLIHGWLDGVCRTAWMREVKEQFYLRQKSNNSTKYNVLLVDWSWGNTPDYKDAGINCRAVGEQTGFVLKNIINEKGVSPQNMHLVGHSLGAIASGFASRFLSRNIGRITALDPAYAPYGDAPPSLRVTYRDAKLVDVIHSNSARCFPVGVGDERFLGHADFYPNGGLLQPSCYPYILISLLKGDFLYALASLEPRLCSHLQSLQYFKESINPKGVEYVGVASQNYESFKENTSKRGKKKFAVMGLDYEKYILSNVRRRMKYYLNTSSTCPYYDDSYIKGISFPFKTSSND